MSFKYFGNYSPKGLLYIYIYYYYYVQPKIPVHESGDGETTRQHVITIESNKYKS